MEIVRLVERELVPKLCTDKRDEETGEWHEDDRTHVSFARLIPSSLLPITEDHVRRCINSGCK